jgi:hypothetical protein
MKILTIGNGSLKMLISPENEMEEAFINMLMKQENDITQLTQQIQVIGHSYDKGLIIGKKELGRKAVEPILAD